jgi:prepilin-type processing-associated H-X9-DG protein
LIRLGQNHTLRWTDELHRFKGNLLFSDGHVEQKNNPALVSSSAQVPAVADLAMPTVRQPGTVASAPGGQSSPWTPSTPSASGVSDSGSFTPATNAKARIGPISVIRPGRSAAPQWVPVPPAGGTSNETPSPPRVERGSTNAVAASTPAKPGEQNASLFPFGLWLTVATSGLIQEGMWWFYALLLLIVVATLVLHKSARRRKKGAARPPTRFP